ncbi:MAG: electron transfer flavoprotein subunit beta/FixA family protein [Dehalococcoidia bacterium]|nr:MAG: electron transfer flavoprotein subunit beta/FixA family protein [Dehalococcoidia bacterium]
MNIIVCIKQVVDPEAPPAHFKVDTTTNRLILPTDIPPVIDPYSEYALEAALQLRDKYAGKITAISLGNNLQKEVIKKPLSMGADELVLVEDELFTSNDSWSIAKVLATTIIKIGAYDVILCGRQSADRDAGQIGSGIAEILKLPVITVARKIDIDGTKVLVERVTDDGYETIETTLPTVITVSNEIGEPRYPTIRGIMAAKKKEPTIWKSVDLDIESSQSGIDGCRSHLVKLLKPVYEGKCEFVDGEIPEDAASNLSKRLRQEKVL